MNNQKEILDAPLRQARREHLNAGPDPTSASSWDYGINQFLLIVAGLIGLGIFYDSGGAIFILLLWNLVLGIYQLISAMVGAIRGNRMKLYYLAGAIAYLFVVFSAFTALDSMINGSNEIAIAGVFFVLIPLGGAVYYTLLCREAKYRGQRL